jgi:hypothetical protein
MENSNISPIDTLLNIIVDKPGQNAKGQPLQLRNKDTLNLAKKKSTKKTLKNNGKYLFPIKCP